LKQKKIAHKSNESRFYIHSRTVNLGRLVLTSTNKFVYVYKERGDFTKYGCHGDENQINKLNMSEEPGIDGSIQ